VNSPTASEPLILHPRRLSREYRVRPLAKGYGERKQAREASKIPLLAGLPGMIKSAADYETAQAEGQARYIQAWRHRLASLWLRVLAWRRTATSSQRRIFASRWSHLPHTPEYALDLIHSIEKGEFS